MCELITAVEYAKLNNKSLSSVKHHIVTGRLPAQKIKGIWYIDKGSPYPPRVRYKDLTGQRFGMLTVKEHAGRKGDKSMWLCVCDCGRTKIVSGNSLQIGYTKSCGCIGNAAVETNVKDKLYGRLTPICPTGRKDSHGSTIWECSCSCGNPDPVFVSVRNLIGHAVTSCGCKQVEAGKKNQSGAAEAAKRSPKSGRFETNVNAKHWVLVAPDGVKYECDNLMHWARSHTALFDMEPGDASARRIFHGFSNIAQSLNKKRKDPVYTYKGWRLDEIPIKNNSIIVKDSSSPIDR